MKRLRHVRSPLFMGKSFIEKCCNLIKWHFCLIWEKWDLSHKNLKIQQPCPQVHFHISSGDGEYQILQAICRK
ncbi:MAG: hypothetical protein ACLSFI_09610 [Christensenellaceae bacterium]